MKNLNLADILNLIGGSVISGNKQQIIRQVAVNPRRIKRDTLYFCFRKRNFNLKSRVRPSIIVTEDPAIFASIDKRTTLVRVKDIAQAYRNFIDYYRNLFKIPVIGVTGTCGKTTTTEMLKRILSRKYSIQATYNGNNALALNLKYLLRLSERTEAAVFEMGVASPGNVLKSCAYFQPNIGVILNIGTYHLLGCSTLETYIKAKAEMLEGLKNKGILIINDDDENIKKIDFSRFKGKIVKIGFNNECHFQAQDIGYGEGGMTFQLKFNSQLYPVFVPGYGQHNVYNALAAIAASFAVGIPISNSIGTLAKFKPVRKHLQFRNGINGSTIIDDTWNCTPPSIKAALEVLKERAEGRKKIAVIGYMPQLGEKGEEEYLKAAELVVKAGVDLLIVLGDLLEKTGLRAIELGMSKDQVIFCHTGNELFKVLQPAMDKNTLVLFKFPYKYRLRKIPSFRQFMQAVFFNSERKGDYV